MYLALRTCVSTLEMNGLADLISIGLVAETGQTFYAEFDILKNADIDDLVQESVVNHLKKPMNDTNMAAMRCYTNEKKTRERLFRWLSQFRGDGGRLVPIVVQSPVDWVHLIKFLGDITRLPANIYDQPISISTFMFARGLNPDYNPGEILKSYPIEGDVNIALDELWKEYPSTALYDAVLLKFSFECVRVITTPRPIEPPVMDDILPQEMEKEMGQETEDRMEEMYAESDPVPPVDEEIPRMEGEVIPPETVPSEE